ncbi:MAG: hypothetical protein MUF15_04955 [Acidobacteria bacterium]|jgi:hypothetical protein|nr:hypothetical protein [Acidobacteriota bacterium]
MEIPINAKKTAANLSKVNLDFLEFVQKNPSCFDRSHFKLLDLKDELFVLQPWPTFINRENRDHFRAVSLKMWELARSIPRRVFNYNLDEMGRFYEVHRSTLDYQMSGVHDEHIKNVTGRIDFILSAEGLKCMECNFSASLGGWQVPIWEPLYLNTPILAPFFKEYGIKNCNENLISHFFEQIMAAAPAEKLAREGQWNTAIASRVVKDGKAPVQNYFNTLYKNLLKQRGAPGADLRGHVYMCDYPDLEIADKCLYFKGVRIHQLVELYNGTVSQGIMEVFKAGNINLINGPVAWILANKLNLALLSDHDAVPVFTAEENEFIDRYVPWSRKIKPGKTSFKGETIDLPGFIRSHRTWLVLKPGHNYGGKGVCVGIKASEDQWEKAVDNALQQKDWLVQEYVESLPGFYQAGANGCGIHDMSWGFFMFGPRYAGLWIRVMPREGSKGVINCHQGASVSVVFNVND